MLQERSASAADEKRAAKRRNRIFDAGRLQV